MNMAKTAKKMRIALLGLGSENRALLELVRANRLDAEIEIKDAGLDPKGFNQGLERYDLLFRSPGWPLSCSGLTKAKRLGRTEFSSPMNLFFALCPTKNIVGITGSKGKGTTASLIAGILKASGKRVWLGGNIGIPPLSFLKKIKPRDYVVLELSSFQLEDLEYSPRLAVITNLFKEHLAPADPKNPNFHASYQKYWQAKLNIARHYQNRWLVANQSLAKRLAKENLPGKIEFFSPSDWPTRLAGEYNRENVGAAIAAARCLGIPLRTCVKAVASFSNLEHRLELVKEIAGARYYDNSFSTTPESTILDLKSFSSPIIQIAGGADKGANFSSLAKEMAKRVKLAILLPGQATPRLKQALQKAGMKSDRLAEAQDMAKAVRLAKRRAVKGDIILLSTACASFGLFKNYKERGDLFKKYVRQR